MTTEPSPPDDTNHDAAIAFDDDPTFLSYLGELSNQPLGDSRIDRIRARALRTAERATTWGPMGPVVEIGWRVWRRDREIAGSALAAALAYRIFIWLLPLSLVIVAGLGAGAQSTANEAISEAGITGYVARSVSETTHSTSTFARITLIVTGTLVFLYETYVLLRTLRAISAFSWRIPVQPLHRPARLIGVFLGTALVVVIVLTLTGKLSGVVPFPGGLLIGIASLLVVPAFFVIMSWQLLPSRTTEWTAFIPGAVLLYVSYAVVHLVATLVIVPWVAHKQATYGVLGLAAGVLFLMFVFGRVIELAFSLNATLYEHGISPAATYARIRHRTPK